MITGKCRGDYYCEAMERSLGAQNSKGLVEALFGTLSGKESTHVLYNRKSRVGNESIYVNFCPWCGTQLFDPDKAKGKQ